MASKVEARTRLNAGFIVRRILGASFLLSQVPLHLHPSPLAPQGPNPQPQSNPSRVIPSLGRRHGVPLPAIELGGLADHGADHAHRVTLPVRDANQKVRGWGWGWG